MALEHEDEVFFTEVVEVTNKQIYTAIKILEKTVKAQDGVLKEIKDQTTKTNGRVTDLEKRVSVVEDHTIWNICKRYHKILWVVFGLGLIIAGTNSIEIVRGWF